MEIRVLLFILMFTWINSLAPLFCVNHVTKHKMFTYSATNSNGVQVVVSALGIHLRFIGVSRVTGNIERA